MKSNLQEQPQEPRRGSFLSGLSPQQDFESAMASELPVFLQIQERALEMMRDELSEKHPSFQNRNSKANRMNENIKGLLFEHYPDQMKETFSKRFYFEKVGEYIILFKKLSEAFMPMNISTKSVKKILSQLSLDFPEVPIVFVGYIPNLSWEELKRVCAVYISSGKVIWVSDLRRFDDGTIALDMFGNSPDDDAPILVRPKNKANRQENNIK
ncbi:hypothetical protein [Pedobacter xixiisoli]|uniref:Uncharacterized protein n=1 Tax=Pedobacter xixiisoli TaxID=1476464 RepID=A0A286A6U3_9SPHI|nr:hypothetical protein [Pedobacter xixiisoli]SOD17625.1 hypothetical protein SAMN06297358_2603 [Pedobacter xixiisoli]